MAFTLFKRRKAKPKPKERDRRDEQPRSTQVAANPSAAVPPEVLRHRVLTTYEAEAEEVTSDQIVSRVLAKIDSP